MPSLLPSSNTPVTLIGFLGRWGTHCREYACPQCLPSDTVSIRSRTWTFRPPAILYPPPLSLSLSLALSLALALVLAPPPSLSLSLCVCAFCCVCTVHVPSFYPIPLPLSLLSLQLACLRLPAVKMHPTSRWCFSTPPIDLRRCLSRTQAAAFVCPPPPLFSLSLSFSLCAVRARARVCTCVCGVRACVGRCATVRARACACACFSQELEDCLG